MDDSWVWKPAVYGIIREYITNPSYGFGYGAEKVSLITTTVPMSISLCRFLRGGRFTTRWSFIGFECLRMSSFFLGLLV
ncbi:hypothetical protein, partial [Rubritalea tangerina]|uniref:hypothetical protein n=1 Tax=Rubritalea tangerina TaxID=430798 RepID=UPI0036153E06